MGADQGIEQVFGELPEETFAGMMELLDALGQQGFARLSQRSREQMLRNFSMVGPEAAAGISTLVGLTLFITYGAPDPETGQNPNWEVFGYPGPTAAPTPTPKTIEPIEPDGDELDARGRRLHRRLRRGRRRDRRDARQGGPEGVRRRGGRLLQRVRLQPARALRLREHVLARRARSRRPTST